MSIKIMLALGLVITCCCVVTLAYRDTPNSRVEDQLIEIALNDRSFMRRQLKCVLDQAHCDTIGRQLKSLIPSVLRGSCPQCTPKELVQIQKVVVQISRQYPKELVQIRMKYGAA